MIIAGFYLHCQALQWHYPPREVINWFLRFSCMYLFMIKLGRTKVRKAGVRSANDTELAERCHYPVTPNSLVSIRTCSL